MPPTELYTLSLHDALPISATSGRPSPATCAPNRGSRRRWARSRDCARKKRDRKSTRLNSSHMSISYAVFCLKQKTFFFILPLIFIFFLLGCVSTSVKQNPP